MLREKQHDPAKVEGKSAELYAINEMDWTKRRRRVDEVMVWKGRKKQY